MQQLEFNHETTSKPMIQYFTCIGRQGHRGDEDIRTAEIMFRESRLVYSYFVFTAT